MLFVTAASLYSQEEIEKAVRVEKQYEPTVIDARKMTSLPEITDTFQVEPEFQYSIFPMPLKTEFRADPIRPARMVSESLDRLYNKFVMIGAGNKIHPSLAFGIHNLRNDKYSIGGLAAYESSSARVQHPDQEKSFAGFGNSEINVYGKQFFPDAIFSNTLNLYSNRRYFYGRPPDMDTTYRREDIKQRYTGVNVNSAFVSNYKDSLHLNYKLAFDYLYFQDRNDHQENRLSLQANLDKFFQTERFGTDAGLVFYERSAALDSSSNLLVNVGPWIGKFESDWQVKAGLNIVSDIYEGETKLYYYPIASFEYNIVNNYIVPYLGVEGNLEAHSYSSTAGENAFILPGLLPEKANRKIELYGGIRGTVSASTSYNIRARYSVVDNMHFFINQGTSAMNQFSILYDDVQLTHFFGEFQTGISDKLDFYLRGNVYDYRLQSLAQPWHKPNYTITFRGRYNIQDKIILSTSVHTIGDRYARLPGSPATGIPSLALDATVDLNAELEYFFSPVFSSYLKFNNITNSGYQLWNYYPSYGFSMQAGIYYAF